MNERELIARLQKRDEAAFEELIRQYEKKVYTLCFRMCGNSEDAEEAAQDAFLALWRGIDRVEKKLLIIERQAAALLLAPAQQIDAGIGG